MISLTCARARACHCAKCTLLVALLTQRSPYPQQYWSLLAPAIEQAQDEGYGDWSFVPATVGFLMVGLTVAWGLRLLGPHTHTTLAPTQRATCDVSALPTLRKQGGLALHVTDGLIRRITKAQKEYAMEEEEEHKDAKTNGSHNKAGKDEEDKDEGKEAEKSNGGLRKRQKGQTRMRRSRSSTSRGNRGSGNTKKAKRKASQDDQGEDDEESAAVALAKARSWRRILLLVVAITLHNAPEGAAVGKVWGDAKDAGWHGDTVVHATHAARACGQLTHTDHHHRQQQQQQQQ